MYFTRKAGHRWFAWGWNIFGFADLILALVLGVLTTPGGTNLLAADFAYLDYGMTGAFPLILIPAYRVPQGLLLHILSMQALSKARSASPQERITPNLASSS